MIELPEGIVLAGQIDGALKGKTIVDLVAAASPHKFAWFNGDPAEYGKLFTGRVIEGAHSYGGKLHVRLVGDGGFMFCDGVVLRYSTDKAELPKKHQLYLAFDSGAYMVCTIQMYGGIFGYTGRLENDYDDIARTKPSVFSPDFSFDYFMGLLDGALKPKHSAKAFLATEQRIPGLGNGVSQDILFNAGISPKRDIATLTPAEIEKLYRSVRETLTEMTEKGGRDTERDFFGHPGGYQSVMSKNTYMFPCPRCGGTVLKEAYMGGSVYFCPWCQK
jgi:formamidopyrimidine-DNA glycosylase